MPVGFKNGTDGDVQIAADAIPRLGREPCVHRRDQAGHRGGLETSGNNDTHVILRGGRSGPNYSSSHVAKALDLISAAGLPRRIMVDASHGNSGKDYRRQSVGRRVAGRADRGRRAAGLARVMP